MYRNENNSNPNYIFNDVGVGIKISKNKDDPKKIFEKNMSLIGNQTTKHMNMTFNRNVQKLTHNDEQLHINQKHFSSVPYPMKQKYNSIIPFNIFQTWHTKLLPPLMMKSVTLIKRMNPKFNYYLFDDNECREFIRKHFNSDVLHAFDSLIPGAYKADLWRYCVLYKKGGIYLDIKYIPCNGFRFINLTEKEHFVLDANQIGIYNALMVCLPENQICLDAINAIVENVKKRYYGTCFLEPTGPRLLWKYFTQEEKDNLDMKHTLIDSESRFIHLNDHIVLKNYNGYIREHDKYKKNLHYSDLWRQRKIYR